MEKSVTITSLLRQLKGSKFVIAIDDPGLDNNEHIDMFFPPPAPTLEMAGDQEDQGEGMKEDTEKQEPPRASISPSPANTTSTTPTTTTTTPTPTSTTITPDANTDAVVPRTSIGAQGSESSATLTSSRPQPAPTVDSDKTDDGTHANTTTTPVTSSTSTEKTGDVTRVPAPSSPTTTTTTTTTSTINPSTGEKVDRASSPPRVIRLSASAHTPSKQPVRDEFPAAQVPAESISAPSSAKKKKLRKKTRTKTSTPVLPIANNDPDGASGSQGAGEASNNHPAGFDPDLVLAGVKEPRGLNLLKVQQAAHHAQAKHSQNSSISSAPSQYHRQHHHHHHQDHLDQEDDHRRHHSDDSHDHHRKDIPNEGNSNDRKNTAITEDNTASVPTTAHDDIDTADDTGVTTGVGLRDTNGPALDDHLAEGSDVPGGAITSSIVDKERSMSGANSPGHDETDKAVDNSNDGSGSGSGQSVQDPPSSQAGPSTLPTPESTVSNHKATRVPTSSNNSKVDDVDVDDDVDDDDDDVDTNKIQLSSQSPTSVHVSASNTGPAALRPEHHATPSGPHSKKGNGDDDDDDEGRVGEPDRNTLSSRAVSIPSAPVSTDAIDDFLKLDYLLPGHRAADGPERGDKTSSQKPTRGTDSNTTTTTTTSTSGVAIASNTIASNRPTSSTTSAKPSPAPDKRVAASPLPHSRKQRLSYEEEKRASLDSMISMETSDDDDDIDGDDVGAERPPRNRDTLITDYYEKAKVSPAEQNFVCFHCYTELAFSAASRTLSQLIPFVGPPFCHYYGRYVCDDCLHSEKASIPAYILHRWDFSPLSISKKALSHIKALEHKPILDLSLLAPNIYRLSPRLSKCREMREGLKRLYLYISSCRDEKKLLQAASNREYMLQFLDLYSLYDIRAVFTDVLTPFLEHLVVYYASHIMKECQTCQGKGFVCELCRSREVIFPFQIGYIAQCRLCQNVTHMACLSKAHGVCPKCDRRRKLREGQASK